MARGDTGVHPLVVFNCLKLLTKKAPVWTAGRIGRRLGDMFSVDNRQLKQFERDLLTYRASAYPHAVRNTLSDLAFFGQAAWRVEMGKRLILKNKYTAGSVRVDKAKGTNLAKLQSVVGSVADYMDDMERGGTQTNDGKLKPLATSKAAGQAKGRVPRTKTVRRAHQFRNMGNQIGRWKKPKNSNADLLVGAYYALKQGRKHFKSRGKIFVIRGGEIQNRNVGGRDVPGVVGLKVDMLYDVTKRAYTTAPIPIMRPTMERMTAQRFEPVYTLRLAQQLKRHRILNYGSYGR